MLLRIAQRPLAGISYFPMVATRFSFRLRQLMQNQSMMGLLHLLRNIINGHKQRTTQSTRRKLHSLTKGSLILHDARRVKRLANARSVSILTMQQNCKPIMPAKTAGMPVLAWENISMSAINGHCSTISWSRTHVKRLWARRRQTTLQMFRVSWKAIVTAQMPMIHLR